MSKYIPKLGETFEWRGFDTKYWFKDTCAGVTKNEIGIESCDGNLLGIPKIYEFRPVPTKADAEREQLEEIIKHCEVSSVFTLIERLQKAGFTIPKKIKRSDIWKVVAHSDISDFYFNEFCDLLGDLVESDV